MYGFFFIIQECEKESLPTWMCDRCVGKRWNPKATRKAPAHCLTYCWNIYFIHNISVCVTFIRCINILKSAEEIVPDKITRLCWKSSRYEQAQTSDLEKSHSRARKKRNIYDHLFPSESPCEVSIYETLAYFKIRTLNCPKFSPVFVYKQNLKRSFFARKKPRDSELPRTLLSSVPDGN